MLYSYNQTLEAPVLGLQDYTNKLLLYHSKFDSKRHLKILKVIFLTINIFNNMYFLCKKIIFQAFFSTDTVFRSDLISCGISLCAHEFTSHFSGNYDFQNFDGIIHDILSNEEFLGQNIHIENADDKFVAFCAK